MAITSKGVKFLYKARKPFFLLALLGLLEIIFSFIVVVSLSANILFPEKMEAAVGVSKILSYQGRLTDSSGNPLGGSGTNYCFRFSIHDAVSGGNKLWPTGTPSDNIVNVANGVFNVGIGEVDDLSTFNFYSNDTIYLQVEVANYTGSACGTYETLLPRQRIDAVAYARATRDVYGALLRTLNADNRVQIGTGAGSGSPTRLALDVKNTTDTIGAACSPSGTLWYNSNNSRALVCDNGTIQEIGNLGTIVGVTVSGNVVGTPTMISSGTLTLAGGANVTLSQEGNAITISAGTAGGGGSIGAISAGTTQATSGTVVFSNSPTVTFGMDGQTITASAAAGAGGGLAGIGASNTTYTSGTVVISGGNNITVGTDSGQKIIISAANQTVQTQNVHNVTLAGNTAGTLAEISSGTMTLAGGNNITLSQAGNAITILGAGGGAAGSNVLGMSNLGNTSGTSGVISGSALQFILAGGNNITLNQSINANSATITISAPNQSIQSYNILAAGTQTANTTGSVVFSNSHNVSFGMSNNSVITASASYSQSTAPSAIVASNATFTSGSVVISGGNNVTVGTEAGQKITISVPAGATATGNFGAIAAGAQTATSGTVIFSNANNVTFGLNNQTLTASASYSQSTAPAGIAVSNIASTFTSGTVQFSAGNLIALSTAAPQAIVISNLLSSATTVNPVGSANSIGAMASRFALEGHQHAGVAAFGASNIGNTSGNTGTQYGTWVLAGTNNITVSGSTGGGGLHTLWISGPSAGAGGIAGIGVSNSTTYTSGTVVFAAGPNITLQTAGQTISISGANPGGEAVLSRWDVVPFGAVSSSAITVSSASFRQFILPEAISFTRIDVPILVSLSSTSAANTAALLISSGLVIYTLSNNSSLIPIMGSFGTTTHTWASNNSNFSNLTGGRFLSFALQGSLSPGIYWAGVQVSTANTSSIGTATTALGATFSVLLGSTYTASAFENFGLTPATSTNVSLGGVYSTIITATNQTIALSHITVTGTAGVRANIPIIFRATH
ncbi:MAG: hypothetical protein N2259_00245 [Patescibacteria group bacterium]|nr:hypothetical protein [Patescibacteria group bacterium]